MHQNATFILLNIKNRLLKEGGGQPPNPLLLPPPSHPADTGVPDTLPAYYYKVSFYSKTYADTGVPDTLPAYYYKVSYSKTYLPPCTTYMCFQRRTRLKFQNSLL